MSFWEFNLTLSNTVFEVYPQIVRLVQFESAFDGTNPAAENSDSGFDYMKAQEVSSEEGNLSTESEFKKKNS